MVIHSTYLHLTACSNPVTSPMKKNPQKNQSKPNKTKLKHPTILTSTLYNHCSREHEPSYSLLHSHGPGTPIASLPINLLQACYVSVPCFTKGSSQWREVIMRKRNLPTNHALKNELKQICVVRPQLLSSKVCFSMSLDQLT